MKTLHFRCNKIIIQEQHVTQLDASKVEISQTADITFQFEDENTSLRSECYGFVSIILPIEVFRQTGYEVGKVYALVSI